MQTELETLRKALADEMTLAQIKLDALVDLLLKQKLISQHLEKALADAVGVQSAKQVQDRAKKAGDELFS
jgi:hypothetical protein